MDWIIPAITAAAGLIGGLGGAWIMGHWTFRTQKLAQREENIRQARKLAYEASIAAWREYRDAFPGAVDKQSPSGNEKEEIQPLQDFIIGHLIFADATLGKIHAEYTVSDIRSLMRATRDNSVVLNDYRAELLKEPVERVLDRLRVQEGGKQEA